MQEIKFFNIRRHIFTHNKSPRKHLSSREIYERKEEARKQRQILANSPEGKEFFDWLNDIQNKLGLSDKRFAELIGIKVGTLYRIKERYGHFPSHKTFNRLFELEKLSKISVKVK